MKFVFLSISLLFFSACNFNQNVAIRGVDLHTQEINGEMHVNLETIVSLGNLKLPNTSTPIHNNSNENLGEVSTQHLEDGTSRIFVSINFNEALKLDSSLGKSLPNGREVTTLLDSDSGLIGIPILENSRIYVGGKLNENYYTGIALNIPAFDHILTEDTSTLNLFMRFPFSNEVLGVAGIYSSPQKTQNGLAIFAKRSSAIKEKSEISQSLAPTEINRLNKVTLFRLNYLFNKTATLKVK